MDLRRLERNIAANEAYVKINYPGENFISEISEILAAKKYIKGLIIPENVKVAESRLPVNSEQRAILRKELRQAEILARLGNSVYLIPEHAAYGERPKDAVVNGQLFEFKTVTGNPETFQWEFRYAKKKGADTNVYINIISDISKEEARRRIWLVLRRHPGYTGEIIISLDNGKKTYFWNTSFFR
jgi:hypothetical protein